MPFIIARVSSPITIEQEMELKTKMGQARLMRLELHIKKHPELIKNPIAKVYRK